MAYESEILRRAGERLAAQRARRAAEAEARRLAVYTAAPEVARIDEQLRKTVARVITAALNNGENPARAVDDLRRENLALQARRRDLIAGAGFAPEDLDDAPACTLCEDSGWSKGRMCACLHALCKQEQVRELSKLLDLGGAGFASFSLDWYPVSPDATGVAPRESMERTLKVAREYAARFGSYPHKNLFLYGGPGLGKTFLSACIARAVAEGGHSVVYDTAVNIFTRFEEQKFSRDAQDVQDAKDETRRYLGCDLLILDDLGSELTTPFVQSALYTLLNTRLTAGRHTIISSNLNLKNDVRARYAAQIASRLEGEFLALPFIGQDIRLLRKGR